MHTIKTCIAPITIKYKWLFVRFLTMYTVSDYCIEHQIPDANRRTRWLHLSRSSDEMAVCATSHWFVRLMTTVTKRRQRRLE